MATQTESGRSLRHKARRHYDEGEHQDDEIEGKRTFTLDDKLTGDRYNVPMVKTMNGEDFTLKWLQEHGFDTPLIFKDSSGLGIRVPSSDFTVNDVKQFVGSRRVVDVMDVNTQKGIEMSMAQFAKYYESPDRKELYNVISLEFSHTRLADTIERPTVVRQIDWVDNVWPRHLIKTQKDSTNVLAEMKYPKVQKYCLMSVKGCYTDFHVDFGGTSVWYHILKGAKVFWLIPPTEENLETYENWVLSGKQGDIFLGDRVLECGRIRLEAGDTFMIPTGWIHAVYTPEDSLVFGGNILHTFNVRRQLRVSMVEDKTRVPVKFRYPFFFEIHWYALARYVDVLLGKSYTKKLEGPQTTPTKTEKESSTNGDGVKAENGVKEEEMDVDDGGDDDEQEEEEDEEGGEEEESKENGGLHVEVKEECTKVTVKEEHAYSESQLPSGNNKTEDASNHGEGDSPEVAIKVEIKQEEAGGEGGELTSSTGEKKHVHLCWAEMEGLINLVEFLESLPRSKRSVPELIENPDGLLEDARLLLELHQDDDPATGVTGQPVIKWPDPPPKQRPLKLKSGTNSNKPSSKGVSAGNRKRRTRCKKCENCTRTECGKCNFCRDMKKFGGPGRMKQSCIMRQCLSPILPRQSNCQICNEEDLETESDSNLMECNQCNEIVHPACLRRQGYTEEGVINEDLQNSWECPKCVSAAGESTDIQSEASSETTPRGRKRKNADSTSKKDIGGGGDAARLKKERVGSRLRGAVVTSVGRTLRRGKVASSPRQCLR